MEMRSSIVAGQFYPATSDACKAEIERCLDQAELPDTLPEFVTGGIVPHAGWTFSGVLAATVFAAVKKVHENVDTFVMFGAAHGYFGKPAVYPAGAWQSPLGQAAVDEQLAGAVLQTGQVVDDSRAHTGEHSIEVQVPFVRHLFPQAKILPIVVPPTTGVVALGKTIGRLVKDSDKTIVCIGSTDLTHYGPAYGFAPKGIGEEAIEWATEVNDKQFIDLALKLDAEGLLESASRNQNACGAGAAAAVVATAKQLEKTNGTLLGHTNSNTVMKQRMGVGGRESVGYAAILF